MENKSAFGKYDKICADKKHIKEKDDVLDHYKNCSNCNSLISKYLEKELCENCIEKELGVKYMGVLIEKFGPVQNDFVIVLHIEGTGFNHNGYSCYTPLEIEETDIEKKLYLPMFSSAFEEFKIVSNELNTAIDLKEFNNLLDHNQSFSEKFPTLDYYVNIINLNNVEYSEICDCLSLEESDNEPHVVSISIIPNDNYNLIPFYSLQHKKYT